MDSIFCKNTIQRNPEDSIGIEPPNSSPSGYASGRKDTNYIGSLQPFFLRNYKRPAAELRGPFPAIRALDLYVLTNSVSSGSLSGFVLTTQRIRRILLLFQYRPVKHIVVLEVHRTEQQAKQLSKVYIVGHLFELQSATVVEVHRKLARKSLHNTNCNSLLMHRTQLPWL